jgi:hypothetical protein
MQKKENGREIRTRVLERALFEKRVRDEMEAKYVIEDAQDMGVT